MLLNIHNNTHKGFIPKGNIKTHQHNQLDFLIIVMYETHVYLTFQWNRKHIDK